MFDKKEDVEEFKGELPKNESESVYFANPYIVGWGLYNKEAFKKGINNVSEICGMYSAFISDGMSVDDAMALIINMQNINMNIELAKINKETQIEVAKNQVILNDKTIL